MCFGGDRRLGVRLRRARGLMGRDEGKIACARLRQPNPQSSLTLKTHKPDLATERERLLTTASANQTTGLTNGKVTNWAPEVEFSRLCALSRRQMTFQFCC